MRVFVTVGSTRFDGLLDAITSRECLQELVAKGFHHLVVQSGQSTLPPSSTVDGIEITAWPFKPSLEDDFRTADLVIGHAGTGTILEVLRLARPLIVVPNPSLLHNHQQELGLALHRLGHLKCADLRSLVATIHSLELSSFTPFPAFSKNAFSSLLDKEMGVFVAYTSPVVEQSVPKSKRLVFSAWVSGLSWIVMSDANCN